MRTAKGIGAAFVLVGWCVMPAAAETHALAARFSLAAIPQNEGPGLPIGAGSVRTLAAGSKVIPPAAPSISDSPFPARPATGPVGRDKTGKVQRPPVRTGTLVGQIMAGAVVTGGAFGLAFLTASESTLDDDEAMQGRAIAWTICGAAGMTPMLVYLIGNAGPQTGSLGRTYLGGLAGALVGGLLMSVAVMSENDAVAISALAAAAVAPALGAIIGFNSSRRYDQPAPVRAALLSVESGRLRLGFPVPRVAVSGRLKRSPGIAVCLFQAEL